MKKGSTATLPNLMSFPAMCAALKISRKKGENLISNPTSDFPRPFKMGGERFFRPEDIQAWINRSATEAAMQEARVGGLPTFSSSAEMIAALNKLAGGGEELSGLEGLGVSLAGEHLAYPVGEQLSRIADALERIASKMK